MAKQGFEPRRLAPESLSLPLSHKVTVQGQTDNCLRGQAWGLRKTSSLAPQVLVKASHEATTELNLERQGRDKTVSGWKGILGTRNSTSAIEKEQSRLEDKQTCPNGWD